MEALARWNHPNRGLISPAVFIPISERSHVAVELGRRMLDRACEQFKLWRDEGLAPPVVVVNVSASQLKLGEEFLRDVQDTLSKWGMSARDLELDVHESLWIELSHTKSDMIERLRQAGIGVAIDDFGSDQSSIGHLWSSKVSRLKIAPQLIEAMLRDESDADTVRSILALARLLAIEIIAESVETEAQRKFLLAGMPTVRAQGYLYSRPVPPVEATALLRRYGMHRSASEHPAMMRQPA
jgi:EAL domain-containing protein (putative c-di-GMP-specific phosphodiesterase class I)